MIFLLSFLGDHNLVWPLEKKRKMSWRGCVTFKERKRKKKYAKLFLAKHCFGLKWLRNV